VHPDEANGFLRALTTGIIEVDQVGRCSLPTLHRATRKPTEPCLFAVKPGTVYLTWREYITQVGALARLVLDYGWPSDLVALAPRNWEFDVGCFNRRDSMARMLIAGETKKSKAELDRLLGALLKISYAQLTLGQLGRSDADKKYSGLVKEQPLYFWAVAPGVSRAYGVRCDGGRVSLEEIPDLPSCSGLLHSAGLSCWVPVRP